MNIATLRAQALASATSVADPNSIATDDARMTRLTVLDDGADGNLLGVALPNGSLYQFKSTTSRQRMRQIRQQALTSTEGGAQVSVDGMGIVSITDRRGNLSRIGELLDYRGYGFSTALTEEGGMRGFYPIALVTEDRYGDLQVTASFGESAIKEIIRLVPDPEAFEAYAVSLVQQFRGLFGIEEDEEGNIVGLSGLTEEALFFEVAVTKALAVAYGTDEVDTEAESENSDTEEAPVVAEAADSGDVTEFDIEEEPDVTEFDIEQEPDVTEFDIEQEPVAEA